MPTTDIIELAIVESIPRDPSAPAPNSLGNRMRDSLSITVLASINAIATTPERTTITDGTNQKLELHLLQIRLSIISQMKIGFLSRVVCLEVLRPPDLLP